MNAQNLVAVVEAKLEAAKAAGHRDEANRWTALLKEAGLLVESGNAYVRFESSKNEEEIILTVKRRKGMNYAIVGRYLDTDGKALYEVVGQSATYQAANKAADRAWSEFGAAYEYAFPMGLTNELVAA